MTKQSLSGNLRKLVACLSLGLSALLIVAVPARAATGTSSGANGFLISPVINEITVDKSRSQSVTVAVQNPTNLPTTAQAIVNDFVASNDESGTPRLILNNNTPLPANNFKALVSPIPNISLGPQEKIYINVTVTVPSNAHAGGYYGAIRFVPTSIGNQGNVGLTASVGTLFLVTVPGNLVEKLDLVQFTAAQNGQPGGFFTSGNMQVLTRLNNVGDIHVQPFGNVEIKQRSFLGIFGKSKVLINYQFNNSVPRTNILPDSIRKYVDKINKKSWLGYYTINANLAYSQGSSNYITASAGFWYLPWWFIFILVIIIIIIIGGIWSLRRRYARRHQHHVPHHPAAPSTSPPR